MALKQGSNFNQVAVIPMRLFELHKEANGRFTLTSELSMLQGYHLGRRLYNDASDTGFAIRNEKTEKVERFYLHNTQRDREGELQLYVFKPEDPHVKVDTVTIFND